MLNDKHHHNSSIPIHAFPDIYLQIFFSRTSPDLTPSPELVVKTPTPPRTPTPPPIPRPAHPSPSTPSSSTLPTYSSSMSTGIGLSTVGVISEGEHLCPNQVPSDGEDGGGGSAGETAGLLINPALLGHKTLDEFLDDPFTENEGKATKKTTIDCYEFLQFYAI